MGGRPGSGTFPALITSQRVFPFIVEAWNALTRAHTHTHKPLCTHTYIKPLSEGGYTQSTIMWNCLSAWFATCIHTYVRAHTQTHTPILQPFGFALINTSLWNPEDTVNIFLSSYQPPLSWHELQAPHDSWAHFLNAFGTTDNYKKKEILWKQHHTKGGFALKCRPGLFSLDWIRRPDPGQRIWPHCEFLSCWRDWK